MTLGKSPEQRVGKRVLRQVSQILVLNLVGSVVGRSNDGLSRESINNDGLVALRIDELVVHDLHRGILARQRSNLIRDRARIRKRRHVLANARERQDKVLRIRSRQLGLALLAHDHDVRVRVLGEHLARPAAHARMDTAAQALVGGADDEEGLLVALEGLGLGLFEDLVGRLPVDAGLVHGALGARELGRGHDLHRLGDLFDVLD